MNTSKNTYNFLFFSIAFLLFVYLCLRAVFVLPVFDEITTYNIYIQTFNFLPHQAYLDANNHLLFSGLSTFLYLIFGNVLFFLRAPSLIAFVMFVFYSYQFSKKLENIHAKYLLVVLLLTIPFVLEFFALARGYGLMLAFFLGLIYHSLIYIEQKKLTHLLYASIFQAFTLASNLSAFNGVIAWLGLIFLLGFYYCHYKNWRFYLAHSFNALSVLAFAYYSFQLKNSGKLYHGGSDFVAYCLTPLHRYLHLNEGSFYMLIVVCSFFVLAFLLRNYFPNFKKPKNLFALFLSIAFIMMMIGVFVQQKLLNINYPEDRAALYLLLSFLLVLIFISDWLSPKIAWGIFALACFYPISLLSGLNLCHSMLWKQEHLPNYFYDYIAKEKTKNKKLSISGHFDSYTLWDYQNLKNQEVNGNIQSEQGNLNFADFLIARRDYYPKNNLNYDSILFDNISGLALLKQSEILDWQHAFRQKYQKSNSNELYQNLFDTIILTAKPFRIFIEGNLKTEQANFEGVLFCTLLDLNGNTLVQEKFTFNHLSNDFNKGFSFSYATVIEKYLEQNEKRILVFLMNSKNQSIFDFQTLIEIDTLANDIAIDQNLITND